MDRQSSNSNEKPKQIILEEQYIKKPSFGWFFFQDSYSYMKKSRKLGDDTTLKDMPLPYKFFDVEPSLNKLELAWNLENSHRAKPSINSAIIKCFRAQCINFLLLYFLSFVFHVLEAFIYNKLVETVSNKNLGNGRDTNDVILYTVLISVLIVILTLLDFNAWNYFETFSGKFRLTLMSLLYKKIHSLRLAQIKELDIGKTINLVSNDINELDLAANFYPNVILAPIYMAIGLGFLSIDFGVYSLISVGILIILDILGTCINNMSNKPREAKNQITDERVKLTNEMIENIRLLKMYAWEIPIQKAIQKIRIREYISYFKIWLSDAIGKALADLSAQLAVYMLFLTYTLNDNSLTTAKVYSSMVYLNVVKVFAISFFHTGYFVSLNWKVVSKRMQDLLQLREMSRLQCNRIEENNDNNLNNNSNKEMQQPTKNISNDPTSSPRLQENNSTPQYSKGIIEFKNFKGYWNTSQNADPFLQIDNLKFQQGKLNAIIGKIGSGKTSILLTILDEITRQEGELYCDGSIAYCQQEPMIFSGTFKSNILFGRDFKEELYKEVIHACSLDQDLKNFPNSDMTLIGEKGVTLSGGQKARVSLARALYSQSDIYLLDDPIAAVDAKVARHLFEKAIRGPLLKGKTILLVTHHLNFAKESDNLICMSDGKVEAQGSLSEILENHPKVFQGSSNSSGNDDDDDKNNNDKDSYTHNKDNENKSYNIHTTYSQEEQISKQKSSQNMKSNEQQQEEQQLQLQSQSQEDEKENNQTNSEIEQEDFEDENSTMISWKTYYRYIKEQSQFPLFIFTFLIFELYQLVAVAFIRYIGIWAEKNEIFNDEISKGSRSFNQEFDHNDYYIAGAIILSALLLLAVIRTILLNLFLLKTNSKLHDRMLKNIIRAKTRFFDKNPIGRILNRFSSDLGILDKGTASHAYILIDGMTKLSTLLVTVCIIAPWVVIPSVIILFILLQIKKFLTKSVLLCKKLDLESRSPLYSLLSSTINGLIIIKTYTQSNFFINDFMKKIYDNSRAFYANARSNTAFGLAIDIFVNTLAIISYIIFVVIAFNSSIDQSLFGLAMISLSELNGFSSWTIRQLLFLDTNMQSTQRMLDYCEVENEDIDNETKADIKTKQEYKQWPNKGALEFQNVRMKYREQDDYAIKDLSFKISPKQKVGVVGRTGAGKSSIIQCLYRMVDIEEKSEEQGNATLSQGSLSPNSFIKIDDVNISSLSLHYLRSNLSIIPQTPVMFSGTIRRNLDPLEQHNDGELWRILQEIDLKDHVEKFEDGLMTEIGGGSSGSIFSAGQKQLVCLGRAMLKKSKLIILDEATANVDNKTDEFIQKVILNKFEDSTVITIAHRLSTIANYDKILVMDKGKAAEYDMPYKLLVQNVGDSDITNTKGIFAQMVRNTKEEMSKIIFDIAAQKYEQITGVRIECE